MIWFENVSVRYGPSSLSRATPKVLDGLSFHVPAGGFRFLTGASGAGKTTLLKLLYGALLPSEGQIRLLDGTLSASSAQLPNRWLEQQAVLRQQIAVVFQDFRLIEHLTIAQNVALPATLAGGPPRANLDSEITDLLTWLGLGDRRDALPHELSGGQQQRVALARAVINRPRLLLADEPTGNLDDGLGQRLIFLLEELNRLGTTTIVATHNSALLERFAHPVLHLEGGRLHAR